AALLLLLHPIHRRGAFMHLADLVALAGVEEDPLSRRGLAGIDVGHDAEIAVVLDGMTAGHGVCLSFGFRSDACSYLQLLPAVVRERAVGFRHPVCVFALLDGVPPV